MVEQNNSSLREMLMDCTTQQLDDMLQAELHKDPMDEAAVRMIMNVLEEREADLFVDVSDDITLAWSKYRAGQDSAQYRTPTECIIRWDWVVKVASILLVLGIAVSSLSYEVNAEAFLHRIARWSESIFELFSPGYQNNNEVEYIFKTNHPGLQQVYDRVLGLGVAVPVVPMYLPDELELTEIKQDVIPKGIGITAFFSGKDGNTVLRFDILSDDIAAEYHKSQTDVMIIEKAGITHYLMRNNDAYTAVWINQNVECLMLTDYPESVLRRILKSIYIMEEE